jgi:glucokinase
VESLVTLSADGLPALIRPFLDRHTGATIDIVALGVAGPIIGDEATLTNVPWRVRKVDVATATGGRTVLLLNDLEAMAHAVPVLAGEELATLQAGAPVKGRAALIAAGTGLGESVLHWVDGRMAPVPTEAGHSDWAPRTDDDLALFRHLRDHFGRVDVERVISGPGLVNIATFTHAGTSCAAAGDFDAGAHGAAAVSAAGLAKTCPACTRAVGIFVEAYGAEAGNLALRAVATGGVYLGGGIAPKLLEALRGDRFLAAFHDKAPMTDLMMRAPVHVIINDRAGLLGAAVAAQARLDAATKTS